MNYQFLYLAFLIVLLIAIVVLSMPIYFVGMFKDAPFVPTEMKVVKKLISLADPYIKDGDKFIELGSGDGRFLRTLAKEYKNISGVGYEWVWWLVKISNFLSRKSGITDRVRFEKGNFFEKDFSDADWIVVYLMPKAMKKLVKKFKKELKPGTKILSHAFEIPDLKLIKELPKDGTGSRCLLYEV